MPDDEKKDPKPKDDADRITTLIHNMFEGEYLELDGKIEINLQESKNNRSTLKIRAPRSVTIKRSYKRTY